jgi:hypothetical protein
MRSVVALILLGLVSWPACGSSSPAQSAAPPFQTVATTKQLMQALVDPAADAVWEAVGTIVTPEGTTEIAPKTDEEWAAVQNHALALAESGNLLMMGSRAGGSDEFVRFSRDLIEQSTRAVKAAEARDATALFTIGGDIYEVCTNCHRRFSPEVGSRP